MAIQEQKQEEEEEEVGENANTGRNEKIRNR